MYRKFLRASQAATVKFEGFLNRIVTSRYNPLYYHGAVPVMLFWTVLITGLLLFLYYIPTMRGAHASIAYLMDKVPYGQVTRSLHRYAADAMMLMVVIHLLRVFFTDRYRKYRHIPWMTGVVLLAILFLVGISGYLLVWDNRAILLSRLSTEALSSIHPALGRFFLGGAEVADRTLSRFLFFHLGLPTLMFFLLWLHYIRISRPIVTPPWVVTLITIGIILVISGALPATHGAEGRFESVHQALEVDWFYLFPYWMLKFLSAHLFWIVMGVMAAALLSLPYLLPEKRSNVAVVTFENCVGCTLCAKDCPYQAIKMVDMYTSRVKRVQPIAVVNAARCAECGICVGSCAFEAINLPQNWETDFEKQIEAALVP